MLFNSLPFVVFFIVVTTLYFLLPYKWRTLMLLLASCFFYMFFKPVYILILFGTIIIDYYAGILIENAEGPKRKFYLSWSLVANIGVLAVFKYYNFINENISVLLSHTIGVGNPIPFLKILLPIGLSFHTFQAMSYTIEVFRGKQKAERNFITYSLYVMFYPQLVAGPIERPQNILHQFYEKHDFSYDRMISGLNLMAWGFFKKLVVADRLSIYVDTVFRTIEAYKGYPLLWSMIFFSVQIYCDFSGYSDIARGSARVMGFELLVNFNRPFFAHKLTEYWRRWHISLYSWFNDYLYNALVVKFRDWGTWAVIVSILITFSISGLWHGASWTFVIWGLMHGIGLSVEALSKKPLKKTKKALGELIYNNITRVITLVFVACTFAVFRADSLHDVFYFFTHLLSFDHNIIGVPIFSVYFFASSFFFLLLALLLDGLIALNWFGLLKHQWEVHYQFISITLLSILIYIFGIFESQSFIYFQF